jgi:cytochrome c biogenesis protein CcmG/thiol:disulfide interchange protein DsbE
VERIVRRIRVGLALGLLVVTGCDRGSHPGNIDKSAPQFVISDDTRTVDLSKLRGQVVVLNLWATFCAPCIEELPSLLALQRKMPDLAVVAVSMDQDPNIYHRFLIQHHVDVLTVRDQDRRIFALYGTEQIPETYIIDRQGVLRRKFVNAQNWTSPEITRYLSKL